MSAIPAMNLSLTAEGMDAVSVSSTFSGDVDDLLAFSRTLQSRAAWPGAQLQSELGEHLIYGVGMRLRGASITDITIDETLGPVEDLGDGVRGFRTAQRVTWPDGHADGFTEYRFSSGSDASSGSNLQFTYASAPPSTKLVKAKHLPEFKQGMQIVAQRYVDGLVKEVARA